MAYEQTLYRVIEPTMRLNRFKRMNKLKKWKYGYNEEHDLIVISKTGEIGEIYQFQTVDGDPDGIKVALPRISPTRLYSRSKEKLEQYWERFELPDDLKRIKTVFEWEEHPEYFKEQYYDYIDEEFRRREEGFALKIKGVDTWMPPSHYMFVQWSKIDVGYPDYRESNRLFYIFWEACKADKRCYGMCYLKNRRSGFSFMSSSELVAQATLASDSRFGILSKTGPDAKTMFTDKVVPINVHYPFFFKPIQDGMDRPKTELAFRVPAKKLTRRKLKEASNEIDKMKGLDTTIDWKNTNDNSYDGEKLKMLSHDESAKWEKPNNIKNNWRVTKTCLRLGSRIVGKCMMGSTANALDKGGEQYKDLYYDSDVTKRNRNGQTKSGLYSMFIPMEWNFEGFIDKYGMPVFDTPTEPTFDPHGDPIEYGVIEHWENEAEALKDDQDALNEFYRQFPRNETHAFRDESKNSLFNLVRIYDQLDFNAEMKISQNLVRGNFRWANGIQDTKVEFSPNPKGRFLLSWTPDVSLQNKFYHKNGSKHPGNEHIGAFGCDSYDISGTVDGRGSKGALHGLTKVSMENAPAHTFFLEYISRPPTAEIFYEDVLMACVFYGLPILIENNKPRLLYHFKRRGYRGFSMNRPDKVWNQLSPTEKEIGGIPNTSGDVMQSHATAIETYIDQYVGELENGYGNMPFDRTLRDWSRFDISKRTKHDASISSGLAIMACNRHLYSPVTQAGRDKVSFGVAKYNNEGQTSKIIT